MTEFESLDPESRYVLDDLVTVAGLAALLRSVAALVGAVFPDDLEAVQYRIDIETIARRYEQLEIPDP